MVQELTAEQRRSGRVARFHGLNEYDCPICLGRLTRQRLGMLVPCLHKGCAGCLRTWLRITPTCPLCKVPTATLVYSIRSEDNYKTRHYSADARADASVPKRRASPSPPPAPQRAPAMPAQPPGSAASPFTQGHGPSLPWLPRPATTAQPQPPVSGSVAAQPRAGTIPRAVVTLSASGELWCSVEETNRIRRLLGLRELDVD